MSIQEYENARYDKNIPFQEQVLLARSLLDYSNLRILGLNIAHARHQKGFTQMDVVIALNLGSQATINKWENNGRNINKKSQIPTAENIHLLAKFLEIPYHEEIYWLGLAGYILPTRMPPKATIISMLNMFYRDMIKHPYPSYILDYRLNYWAVNPATIGLVGDFNLTKLLLESFSNVLSIVFNSQTGLQERISDIQNIQDEQLRRFIAKNLHRRHEAFWSKYPECLGEFLNDEDYCVFKTKWGNLLDEKLDVNNISELVTKAIYGYITLKCEDGLEIEFKIIAESILYFLGNTFEVVRYYPASDKDKENADRYFAKYHDLDPNQLKLWELRDIDEILVNFDD